MKKMKFFAAFAAVAILNACSAAYYDKDMGGVYDGIYGESTAGAPGEGDEGGNGNGNHSGVLTAGEWNDLDHWDFWGNLMNNQEYAKYQEMWQFYPVCRFAVKVSKEDGSPAVNAELKLFGGKDLVWTARTDNKGNASLWAGLYSADPMAEDKQFSISVDGQVQEGQPQMSMPGYLAKVNEYVAASHVNPAKVSDILFIVDATGSMMDEINFLKDDLLNVLDMAEKQVSTTLRTGALFYRDKGDDYVTRESKFTEKFSNTVDFIKKQSANGGGDYPEAVHTALEHAIQKLSWKADAHSKIAFLILDAPAHHDHDGVIPSLQKSISLYAEQGIRLIPVLASGAGKEVEMMCRFFSIATGGTYTFLTDDSGVSVGEHIDPSVGEYEVELLKDLMLRLIVEYTE